ncbi:hypothetical protein J6590_095667 [Homalodisca vitripennis]|nr:hypothetical protein J6590_095667 [Homalodisca vitripennis]
MWCWWVAYCVTSELVLTLCTMWFEISFDTFTAIPPATIEEWCHIVVSMNTVTLDIEVYVYPFEPDSGDEHTI